MLVFVVKNSKLALILDYYSVNVIIAQKHCKQCYAYRLNCRLSRNILL